MKYNDYRKSLEKEQKISEFNKQYKDKYDLALFNLLKLEDFRFFISDLLGYSKTFSESFDEKGNIASYNSGRQSVGMKIFKDIMYVSPNSFIDIQKEERERSVQKEKILENINGTTK